MIRFEPSWFLAFSLAVLPACDGNGGRDCPDASVPMEVYFSPQGGVQQALIGLVDGAQTGIDAAVYIFTSNPIASRLIAAKDRGVSVRVVVDSDACDTMTGALCGELEQAGIPVRRKVSLGLMHNKFVVVDQKIVATGSANWSAAAENDNQENVLVLHDQDVARIYLTEFEELFGG